MAGMWLSLELQGHQIAIENQVGSQKFLYWCRELQHKSERQIKSAVDHAKNFTGNRLKLGDFKRMIPHGGPAYQTHKALPYKPVSYEVAKKHLDKCRELLND